MDITRSRYRTNPSAIRISRHDYTGRSHFTSCITHYHKSSKGAPPALTTDFTYIRFIGDRSINEKDFGKIQKDRQKELALWAKEVKKVQKEISLAIVAALLGLLNYWLTNIKSIFFFEFFAALLFLCFLKVLFKLFALFGALVREVGFTRRAADRALELYRLAFKVKRKFLREDFVALAAYKGRLDIFLAELVCLHPEGGGCQVFSSYV